MSFTAPRGRIYQDSEFSFEEFNELRVEQIIVCENRKAEPIIVYLKVENRNWHQYFLDAGIGFWENWDELIDVEDDVDYKHIDSTDKFKLRGKRIAKIYCKPDSKNSKIVIEFDNQDELILRCVDPKIFDSEYELIKITK